MLNLTLQCLILGCHSLGSKDLIHFLQSTALGLWDQEDDIEHGQGGDASKEDERPVVSCFDKWGGEQTHGEVVQLWIISPEPNTRNRPMLTQLLLPPMLTPLARILKGNTSETTIHETGPRIAICE